MTDALSLLALQSLLGGSTVGRLLGAFFRFARLPLLNHPAVFACLGMVIGLYGVLYLEVARAPERGWVLAAIGLAGKILGPIGLAALVAAGTWPSRAVVLSLANDVVWWAPFGLYLRDAWPAFRADAPPR